MRFAVLQPGARMHYAVPAVLARAGMLERFYTDIANVGLVRHVERVWPRRVQPKAVTRLFGRRLPADVEPHRVRQSWRARLLHGGDTDRALIRTARRDGFGGADGLYTTLINSDLDLVGAAKDRGMWVAHETLISPDSGLHVLAEQKEFGVEPATPEDEVALGRERDARKYGLVDRILVPSEFVRRAVLDLGAPADRIVTVPYAVSETWFDTPVHPVPGRVLFVGSVGLRKGNHYLAAAARALRARGVACEVRVVGPVPECWRDASLLAGPTYVGQVPRSEIVHEFSRADIFVLPSVAEGSAVSIYEALSCGIPVITTPNAGSVVRDGLDGFLVPARTSDPLADRIAEIVGDRALRARLSRNARQRAREFTWTRYGERLIAALGK